MATKFMEARNQSGLVVAVFLLLCAATGAFSAEAAHDRPWRSLSPAALPSRSIKTDRPIIGIVTLPVMLEEELVYGSQIFATSYARFVQAGGARVAPIFYDSSEEELDAILGRVNGVLWTGSVVEDNPADDQPEGFKYRRTTEYILEYAIRENQKGNYYPLWGTCLGFERLMELLVETETEEAVLVSTDAVDLAINLDLTPYGLESRLFGNLSSALLNEVTHPKSDIVFNNHELGVRPETFARDPWMASAFRIVSTSEDRNGKVFVSSLEGRHMPLYGSQWHPEKSVWEWNKKLHPSHSASAVEFSNFVGRFFVQECKYNGNSFADEAEERAALIHNWFSYPTGKSSVFSEVYFFWSSHPNVRPSVDVAAQQLHPQHPILLDLFKALL